jgi:hypothetical protein
LYQRGKTISMCAARMLTRMLVPVDSPRGGGVAAAAAPARRFDAQKCVGRTLHIGVGEEVEVCTRLCSALLCSALLCCAARALAWLCL